MDRHASTTTIPDLREPPSDSHPFPPPFSQFLLKPAQKDYPGWCVLGEEKVQERIRGTKSPLDSVRLTRANVQATGSGHFGLLVSHLMGR